MESYPMYVISVSVCFCVLTSVASGLRCFTCNDVEADSSSTFVKNALNLISDKSEYCKREVTVETPGIRVVSCPSPQPGKVSKCVHTYGRSQASLQLISKIDFSLHINSRACVEVDSRTPDGCHSSRDNVQDETLLSTIISIASVTFGSYEGRTCFCSSDLCNGRSKLTPATVTWLASLVLAMVFIRWCN